MRITNEIFGVKGLSMNIHDFIGSIKWLFHPAVFRPSPRTNFPLLRMSSRLPQIDLILRLQLQLKLIQIKKEAFRTSWSHYSLDFFAGSFNPTDSNKTHACGCSQAPLDCCICIQHSEKEEKLFLVPVWEVKLWMHFSEGKPYFHINPATPHPPFSHRILNHTSEVHVVASSTLPAISSLIKVTSLSVKLYFTKLVINLFLSNMWSNILTEASSCYVQK